jgi:organic hydroperoxide reductase OsmC/OhrA
VATTAKTFTYAVEVDRDGRMRADGEGTLHPADAWSPDHLLLAALVRCVLESLGYHAGRIGLEAVGAGEAHGLVTKREEDGRFAFVEIECSLDVELAGAPPRPELRELLDKAERDCFVGASLTVAPGYRWRVNGSTAE